MRGLRIKRRSKRKEKKRKEKKRGRRSAARVFGEYMER